MRIKDFITDETPTLKSVDTALDGLDMMDDFKLRHLPLLFRIVAQDPWEMRFWSSKAVALAPEEEED